MIILHNGVIYGSTERATALAIEANRIIAVGSDADVLNLSRPGTQQVDLEGAYVLPGLTDSHIHLDLYGQSLLMVDCSAPTKAECLEQVYQRSLEVPDGSWITGHGWNQNIWESGFGSAHELDQFTPAQSCISDRHVTAQRLGEHEGDGAGRHHRCHPRPRWRHPAA